MPFFYAFPHRTVALGAGLVLGFCLVFVLSLPATAQAPSADPDDFIEGHYWALIIGINKYPNLNKDSQLEAARKDAEAVAKLLKERYGFSRKRMIELYDEAASSRGIIRAFSSMKRRLTDKDSLFIYFSGRGDYESTGKDLAGNEKKDGMGFWLPFDAELDDPASDIFNSQMRDYAANIPARHIFMAVDSVFSESLMGRVRGTGLSRAAIKELYQAKSRWVFASGEHYPVPGRYGHSTFALNLMKALNDNNNRYLLASAVVALPCNPSLMQLLPACRGEQLPKHGLVSSSGDEGGQFVFRLRKEFVKEYLSTEPRPSPEDLPGLMLIPPHTIRGEEFEARKQEMLERIRKQREERAQETEAQAFKKAAEAEERQALSKEEKERVKKAEDERLAAMKQAREEAVRKATEELFKNPRPMVTIPAGEFIMGDESGKGQPDESPQRKVYLDAYTIDKYEVTVVQFAEYLKKSGAEPPDFWDRVNQKEDMNRPVVGVDWLEDEEY